MVTRREWVLLLFIAGAPIAVLWIYQGLQAGHDYEGTCGLLDAGWTCSKARYVEFSLFNAFVFPSLAAVTISWVIAVAIAAWLYFRPRNRRKEHIGPRPEMVRDEKPLNIATLRLTGSDASLDEVVGKLRLTVSSRVRAGDPRRRGGVHAASGLSASIADAANPVAMMKQVRAFIQECLKHCPNLFPEAVDAELAVGISVGDSVQFVASVDLSPADIRDLAAVGIAFSVAAYPTSDENEKATIPE